MSCSLPRALLHFGEVDECNLFHVPAKESNPERAHASRYKGRNNQIILRPLLRRAAPLEQPRARRVQPRLLEVGRHAPRALRLVEYLDLGEIKAEHLAELGVQIPEVRGVDWVEEPLALAEGGLPLRRAGGRAGGENGGLRLRC